jgi:hypothetical protein
MLYNPAALVCYLVFGGRDVSQACKEIMPQKNRSVPAKFPRVFVPAALDAKS